MPPSSQQKSDFNKIAERAGKGVDAPIDEIGRTLLQRAARNDDIPAVTRLLLRGANAKQVDAHGQTALYDAIATHDIELVKLLIGNGASFVTEDDAGVTPLLWAIEKKADLAFLDQLRGLGMALDFQSSKGQGALHAAVAANDLPLIDYLLQHDVPPDAADKDGKTPLHLATEKSAYDAMRHLLAGGASPIARTKEIKTPLYIAAAKGDEAAVDMLLAIPEVRYTINEFRTFEEGWSPLTAAVIGNSQTIAEKLIDAGAFVNQVDNQNRHSLFNAVEFSTPAMVEMLIRRGADVAKAEMAKHYDVSTPMILKINAVHYKEILHLLVAAGADVNGRDTLGQTALYCAVSFQESDKVKELLALHADTELAITYGGRPLDAAMAHTSPYYPGTLGKAYEIVGLLLDGHANPNMAPSPNTTEAPLHVAVYNGDLKMTQLLIDHHALIEEPERFSGMTPWLVSVSTGHAEVGELLRKNGADTFKKDSHGRGLIHIAAKSGNKAMLEFGLRDPAYGTVNTVDGDGSTPLHLATYGGAASECAGILLAAGADPLVYDAAGFTPLHIAARTYDGTVMKRYAEALGQKTNWNVQTRLEKDTPLHLAARIGNQKGLEILLTMNADVTIRNIHGATPIMSAIEVSQYGNLRVLIEHMKQKHISIADQRDNEGLSPLHVAAKVWSATALIMLLDAGEDINLRTPAGDTPLLIAIRAGRPDAVRRLIAHGADITLANKMGETALSLATGKQDILDIVQQAIKEKQQKNAPVKARSAAPKP